MKKIFLLTFLLLFSLASFSQAETQVIRIAVAKDIIDHEPVEANNIFKNDVDKLYCFTEIKTDMAPTGIVHVWFYNGEKIAEVPLNIGAVRWRTYSSKKMIPQWTGNWRVDVYSADEKMLESTEFIVLE